MGKLSSGGFMKNGKQGKFEKKTICLIAAMIALTAMLSPRVCTAADNAATGVEKSQAASNSVAVSSDIPKITSVADSIKTFRALKDANEKGNYQRAIATFKPKNEKDVLDLIDIWAENNQKGELHGAARQSLANITEKDKDMEPIFVKLLREGRVNDKLIAIGKCSMFRSKKALPDIFTYMKKAVSIEPSKEDGLLAINAANALPNYGVDALPELLKMAKDPIYPKISKQLILDTIGEIRDTKAIPQFLSILKDKSQPIEIRQVAIETLGWIGTSEPMYELMEMYKTEQDVFVRSGIISAVGNAKNEAAIPFLRGILMNDSEANKKGLAVNALCKIGTAKSQEILLESFGKEKNKLVRENLAVALRELTGKNYDWRLPE